MSDITWGPEILVGGVRPAWLGDDEQFEFWSELRKEWSDVGPYFWSNRKDGDKVLIRLPAEHSQYHSADTVSIKRMTEEQWERKLGAEALGYIAIGVLRHLNLIRPETLVERFTRETGHEATDAVEAALAFER